MTRPHHEVPMPRKTTTRTAPRPPSLTAAERTVRATWLKPTQDGLQTARRKLVRAMWRARRAGLRTRYTQLRTLYRQVLAAQAARDWESDVHELARRARNVQDPTQYHREQIQQLPGQSALLTLSSPGERYQQPRPAPRPLGRTRTRIVHDDFSGKTRRERERAARDHAEQYYQALRAWDVHQIGGGELPREKGKGSGGGRMRPVVGNWASAPYDLGTREVDMPWRNVPEGVLAQLVNTDPTLSAIRDGTTVSTLVNPAGGWFRDKPQAVRYAQAVLTLAFHLGDPHAQEHLRNLPIAEISR
ncbi:hypothetical protein [Deinococcus sp. JMULE3]|uniref:hypothetical protein n=1 Tax=Deinococcus sp. JMULE3 TaxID=2518341 RepID=UPI001576A799|nr:hypothetical protein [Deinococcus sp. JMULE3]NTY02065.1 hypothetical protein [Deinococcus sp. JMULE3]